MNARPIAIPRSLIAAIALAAAAASGAAGAQALTVVARTPRYAPAPAREDDATPELRRLDPKDAEMPWVDGGRPGVATRINDALFLQLIEMLAPRAAGDTYTPLPPPHEGLGYFFCDMHFGVDRNDGRVLSVRMAIEYRGSARCTSPDAELEPLLTPYGRRLLLGKGMAPAPADRFGETLHGHVGTAAVTLHLGSPRGERREVDAVYAYDRIGSAITLSGTAHGDALDLTEDGDKGLTLRQVGRALVGTWHGKGKTWPVRLE